MFNHGNSCAAADADELDLWCCCRLAGADAPPAVVSPVTAAPLPPPPVSGLPQPAFDSKGLPRPPPAPAAYGAAPGPGFQPPRFGRFNGPPAGMPGPGPFALPGPPPREPPSQTSLIDDILGKKSIKDRQQTEKCVALLVLSGLRA